MKCEICDSKTKVNHGNAYVLSCENCSTTLEAINIEKERLSNNLTFHNFVTNNDRMNRKQFIISYFFLLVICAISFPLLFFIDALAQYSSGSSSAYFVAILYLFVIFNITIKRLHDINAHGIYSLLVLMPIVNFVLILFLAIKKGSIEDNKHGPSLIFEKQA